MTTLPDDIREALRPMAQRGARAESEFIQTLCGMGVTEETARLASAAFFRLRLARIDYGIGRVLIRHGGFLEKAVIERAAADERTRLASKRKA